MRKLEASIRVGPNFVNQEEVDTLRNTIDLVQLGLREQAIIRSGRTDLTWMITASSTKGK